MSGRKLGPSLRNSHASVARSHLDDFETKTNTPSTPNLLQLVPSCPLHFTVARVAKLRSQSLYPTHTTYNATSTMADIDMDVDMDIDLGLDPEIAQLEAEAMKIVRQPVAVASNTR
jgi:hypothetical protein